MRVTARGWIAVFATAFLIGAFFPWGAMPWNTL